MILQIADQIEQIVKGKELHPFGGLQRRRSHFFGKNYSNHKLFNTNQNLIEDGYTYHYGGSDELQFNFGWDKIEGQRVFRYGIAFSLQPSRTLPNPIDTLGDQIKRFNKFFEGNPNVFESCSYWVHQKNTSNVQFFDEVDKISEDFINTGNFIFIGKYFQKDSEVITKWELKEVVSTLDELMPVYEAVVLGNYFDEADERIVRLAWNKNNWEKPSGPDGKSDNKGIHEGKYGFGFEEWLFDKSKMIDGYIYGFLQPFHTKEYDTYKLTTRDIKLFTRDHYKKYWIGDIKKVEVLSDELADYALKINLDKGWIEDRRRDLYQLGIEPELFDTSNEFIKDPSNIFNIRFRPSQTDRLFDEIQPFTEEEIVAVNTDHYVPVKTKNLPKKKVSYTIQTGDGVFNPKEFKNRIERSVRAETREYRNVHDEIQKAFSEWLYDFVEHDELYVEHRTEDGRKLDVYMVNKGVKRIFEVKSYNSLKTSLKIGLGQLINYRFFPNLDQADEIFLVSNIEPSESEVAYINHLNKELNLNFGYIQFDEAKQKLIKQVGVKFYDH